MRKQFILQVFDTFEIIPGLSELSAYLASIPDQELSKEQEFNLIKLLLNNDKSNFSLARKIITKLLFEDQFTLIDATTNLSNLRYLLIEELAIHRIRQGINAYIELLENEIFDFFSFNLINLQQEIDPFDIGHDEKTRTLLSILLYLKKYELYEMCQQLNFNNIDLIQLNSNCLEQDLKKNLDQTILKILLHCNQKPTRPTGEILEAVSLLRGLKIEENKIQQLLIDDNCLTTATIIVYYLPNNFLLTANNIESLLVNKIYLKNIYQSLSAFVPAQLTAIGTFRISQNVFNFICVNSYIPAIEKTLIILQHHNLCETSLPLLQRHIYHIAAINDVLYGLNSTGIQLEQRYLTQIFSLLESVGDDRISGQTALNNMVYQIVNHAFAVFRIPNFQYVTGALIPPHMRGAYQLIANYLNDLGGHPDFGNNYLGSENRSTRRMNPANINHSQSTHTESVHFTVSKSSSRLNVRYENDLNEDKCIKEIIEWASKLDETDPEQKDAQEAIDILLTMDFIDSRSHISMRTVLALVWFGIHDPNNLSDKILADLPPIPKQISQSERLQLLTARANLKIERLKHTFIKNLFEIKKEYLLDMQGKKTSKKTLHPEACEGGSFNKLVITLDRYHTDVLINFVNDESIAAKCSALTIEALTDFYKRLLIKDRQSAKQLIEVITKQKCLPDEIWMTIRGDVKLQLGYEFFNLADQKTLDEMLEQGEFVNIDQKIITQLEKIGEMHDKWYNNSHVSSLIKEFSLFDEVTNIEKNRDKNPFFRTVYDRRWALSVDKPISFIPPTESEFPESISIMPILPVD